MPDPTPISQSKQLIVEGNSSKYFFIWLLKKLSLNDVQVQNFGGISELRGFLGALSSAHGFAGVGSLGIARDAENNPNGAFQSVCGALRKRGLPVPAKPLTPDGDGLKVSVMILPDSASPGMLEDLCLRSVKGDRRIQCVDEYFQCIGQVGTLPTKMAKARVHAFLASCKNPELILGQAAQKGYWPWDSPAFDQAKNFLRAL